MPAVRKRLLIIVKTYRNPSSKYDETVCTAGIDLDAGRFVRLYPVRFRHLKFDEQFKKWDIVELDVQHKGSDPRGDTWTPVGFEYEVVDHVGTGHGKPPDWAERREIVMPLVSTIEELQSEADNLECSLGVVKVHAPAPLRAVPDPGTWSSAQISIMGQQNLLGPQLRPLERPTHCSGGSDHGNTARRRPQLMLNTSTTCAWESIRTMSTCSSARTICGRLNSVRPVCSILRRSADRHREKQWPAVS